ncbi:MAG: redoxin domain-containing protein [Sedimentisphaerales bacterium]|nr:redoxin domain-containing protein [Sedimentisphaerales bacterium]
MNSECQKYKDKIIDLVSGLLEESEIESLQQHLEICPECNEYANALKSEDVLLSNFFTQVDSDMHNREHKILDTINTPEQKETVKFKSFIKLAAAAAIIIIVLFGLGKYGNSNIVWADVVNKFKSVNCFNAVMYWKENFSSETAEIELWMNKDGKTRLLSGNQVIYAQNGQIIEAYDIKNRQEVQADARANFLVREVSSSGEFSLQTIINSLAGKNLEDVTPKINSDAIISQDITVFDIEYNDLEWFRIWALKESKLPIRIKMWTPNDGGSVDIVFTYSKGQPDEFFDPNAFAEAMKNKYLSETNLAYIFLNDPANKKISPVFADENKAFEIITQTIDGKPWSLKDFENKFVILVFWSDMILNLEKYQEVYEKIKNRDDFVMVGVNLDPSADSVKAYCKKEGIEWDQLHEFMKPWKNKNGMVIGEPDNKLAKALGITYFLGNVLIKKDGSIVKIQFLDSLNNWIEALNSNVMLCPSQEWWSNIITQQGKNNGHMSQDEIVQRFGRPDSIENRGADNTVWKYEAFMEKEGRFGLLTIHFYDKSGEIVGAGAEF